MHSDEEVLAIAGDGREQQKALARSSLALLVCLLGAAGLMAECLDAFMQDLQCQAEAENVQCVDVARAPECSSLSECLFPVHEFGLTSG